MVGVQFEEGYLIQDTLGFQPEHIQADFSKNALFLSPWIKKDMEKQKKISMPSAMGITANANSGYNATSIFEVDKYKMV